MPINMNSQQLPVPAQGRQKKGPFNCQAWKENSLGTLPQLLCYLLPIDWRRGRILTFSCIPTDNPQHGLFLRHSNNAKRIYVRQFYFKTVRNALPILTHTSDIVIYCIFFLPGNSLGTLKTFVLFYPMSVILNLEAIKLGIINSGPLGMF